MNLIKLNLLPYREMKEAKQKKEFQVIMLIGGLLGLAAAGLVYMGLSEMLDNQNQRNQTMEEGLKALDRDLVAIKDLQKRKQDFLLRKSKVEELDNKRFEGARIIDTLNQLVPDGVYLLSIKGDNNDRYTIVGRALTDQKVATFMRSLPSTGVFDQPTLVNITQNEEVKAQQFEINTKLLEQKMPVSTSNTGVEAASTPTPAQ